MGNTINQWGTKCGKAGVKETIKEPSNMSNFRVTDRTKINNFKNKVKKLTDINQKITFNKVDVIQDAIKDLNITEEPITSHYTFGKSLGSGKYGIVKLATSNINPDFKVAVKIIELQKLTGNYHSCVSEIVTLKKVDHPNIVKIQEIYKDEKCLYIVMEYVDGKELFEFVVERTKINELDSANITQQLLKTIKYLNSLKICHRDIKPENILINPKSLHIKLIDFGLSCYFEDSKNLTTKVGTPYYVSPEVLKGNYSKEWDIWSIGVITYILLTGWPPFQGENLAEVYNEILYEKLKLYRSDWEDLSPHSLDFVKNMLKKNPEVRLTPDKALEHPFVLQKDKSNELIKPSVLAKLAKNNHSGVLKKEIFSILSTYIKSETIDKWNKWFHSLDTNGTGEIKISEIIKMLKESNCKVERITQLETAYSNNMDAKISYSDFLTKVINIRREIKESDVQKAFEQLDVDKSGKIDAKDLKSLLHRRGHEHVDANSLLNEVDTAKMMSQHPLTSNSTDTYKDYSKSRYDISYGTFKEYLLGDDGEASEDFSWKSSFMYADKNINDSIEDTRGTGLGSILIETNDKTEYEEEKYE